MNEEMISALSFTRRDRVHLCSRNVQRASNTAGDVLAIVASVREYEQVGIEYDDALALAQYKHLRIRKVGNMATRASAIARTVKELEASLDGSSMDTNAIIAVANCYHITSVQVYDAHLLLDGLNSISCITRCVHSRINESWGQIYELVKEFKEVETKFSKSFAEALRASISEIKLKQDEIIVVLEKLETTIVDTPEYLKDFEESQVAMHHSLQELKGFRDMDGYVQCFEDTMKTMERNIAKLRKLKKELEDIFMTCRSLHSDAEMDRNYLLMDLHMHLDFQQKHAKLEAPHNG